MPSLADAAGKIAGGIDFLMLDPVVAAVGTKTNSHNNAETRNALQPVLDFAESTDCAVLGVTHFTKGTIGKDPVERVTGSAAFGALARIIIIAAKHSNGASSSVQNLILVQVAAASATTLLPRLYTNGRTSSPRVSSGMTLSRGLLKKY